MAVLVDANTRLLVQGIGTEGANHMRRSIAYGTNVVAAIHPRRGGEQQDGVPIFPTVDKAVRETGANVSTMAGEITGHVMLLFPETRALDCVDLMCGQPTGTT